MIEEKKKAGNSSSREQNNELLNHQAVVKAYHRYGRLYNLVFGPIMEPGRKEAVKAMNCKSGEKILELGVGSGLALHYYPEGVSITGIDLSPDMLKLARERVEKDGLKNVELLEMDAQDLQFPDNSFPKIAVMYVASVVPDPQAMLSELRRVCQPDGDIFVLNHFASRNRVVRGFEKLLAPLANLVGFHSDFDLDKFVADSNIHLENIMGVNLFGYWKMLHFRNRPPEGKGNNH